MFYGYENLLTISLFIISMIIVIWANANIQNNYKKYRRKKLQKPISGFEVAQKILEKNGLKDIYVVETKGELSDHYDPKRKVIRLSKEIFHGETIASTAIAAHEVGHAIQDKEGYLYMKIRYAIFPIVNLVTKIGYFVMIVSLIAGLLSYFYIGMLVIFATLLFQIVTLPVEFDASRRAMIEVNELGLVEGIEKEGVNKLLKAAALTYVASVITSLLQLLRLFIMSRD